MRGYVASEFHNYVEGDVLKLAILLLLCVPSVFMAQQLDSGSHVADLIRESVADNYDEIRSTSVYLTPSVRQNLMDTFERSAAYAGLGNAFIGLGIGSWVQREPVGGWFGLVGELVGWGVVVAGIVDDNSYLSGLGSAIIVPVRVISAGIGTVAVSLYNSRLADALRIHDDAAILVAPGIQRYADGSTATTIQLYIGW